MDQSDLELLRQAPPYHLQAVAKTRHLSDAMTVFAQQGANAASSTTIAAPVLHEFMNQLYDEHALLTILAELSELEALVLRELVSCGGRANSRDLALYFSCAGLIVSEKTDTKKVPSGITLSPPLYPTAHPHGPLEQAVRHLLLLGSLFWGRQTNFSGREYTSGMHDGVLIVPHSVVLAVRQFWQLDKDPSDTLDVPHTLQDGVRDFQRSLYLYWSFVSSLRDGLSLVNNGLLSRAALRQVPNQFALEAGSQVRLETDIPRLLFIRLLLQQLGLLQERDGMLLAQPAEKFFTLPLLERARLCYRLFCDRPFWNELVTLPDVTLRPVPLPLEPAHEEVVRSRQRVAERMLYESTQEWTTFAAFIARMKIHVPYLLFPRQYGARAERYSAASNPYGWDFRLRRGWLTHREGWHLIEGSFIRSVLTGPLLWLGLVQISPDGTAFRLSSDAALLACDASVSLDDDGSPGRIIVQPNFEMVVFAPVAEYSLVLLDRFAERINLEHIARYRITRASVTRAIQRGLHADALLADLARFADEIPQNVRYSILEWERQARRIEIWPDATLLEVDDPLLLDELLADEQTRPFFRRRLSPSLIEVSSSQLHAVEELLWQRNYLPALSASPESALSLREAPLCEPQWHLTSDGIFQPAYAVLNLYLAYELKRFTVVDAETGYQRITPESLELASVEGISFDYVLTFLRRYCMNGLPGSLLLRMKHWGKAYSDQYRLSVAHKPFLVLPAEILHDIQHDEEIQTLLGQVIEPDYRLVRIKDDGLARLQELLRQRGFSVDDDFS